MFVDLERGKTLIDRLIQQSKGETTNTAWHIVRARETPAYPNVEESNLILLPETYLASLNDLRKANGKPEVVPLYTKRIE